MRMSLRLCLAFISISALLLAQSPTHAQDKVVAQTGAPTTSQASLQDTQQFISDKVKADTSTFFPRQLIEWNSCSMVKTSFANQSDVDFKTYPVLLRDVESVAITAKEYKSQQWFAVVLKDDAVVVTTDDYDFDGNGKPRRGKETTSNTGSVPIDVSSHELAVRLANAFAHAITLCGGPKKQPF